MTVLHLSSEKTWRGGEQQIAYLIEELTKLGIQNIVAAREDSSFEKYCKQNKIDVVSLPFRNSFDLTTAYGIKKLCTNKNISIVHMHSAKSHAVGVLSALLGNKLPLILSRRVDFVPKETFLTKWKYNHPSIRRIVCVSNKIRSIMQTYVDTPSKCVTIHSGIDLSKNEKASDSANLKTIFNIPQDKVIVVNTAALEQHKDYFTFIDVIAELRNRGKNAHGLIFGKGSLASRLNEYVVTRNLTSDITFAGFRTDLAALLSSCDVFLITSEEEGLGTSVLDAFSASVPVVATAAGGIPEMVDHEETGLLAPVRDVQSLSTAVVRILEDASLKNRIKAGAKMKVSNFSKEKTALETFKLYQDVLQREV